VQLGQAEVQNAQPALPVDHDVVRLEVTVGDARAVSAADGIGERDPDLQ
jgi:hypothetical protein